MAGNRPELNNDFLHLLLVLSHVPMFLGRDCTGRPGHLATAQQMHVQVEDTLTCMFPIINDDAIAFLQLKLLGDFGGRDQQPAQYIDIFVFGLGNCLWVRC